MPPFDGIKNAQAERTPEASFLFTLTFRHAKRTPGKVYSIGIKKNLNFISEYTFGRVKETAGNVFHAVFLYIG